jgi:hypothetical protein
MFSIRGAALPLSFLAFGHRASTTFLALSKVTRRPKSRFACFLDYFGCGMISRMTYVSSTMLK